MPASPASQPAAFAAAEASPTEHGEPAEPAVRAAGLSFFYGAREALAGVDFAVPTGSVFGFLGPNGSGKTTLFRILATLLAPGGGRVEVLGCDLATGGAALDRVRRALGVVFQLPSLDLRLTVRENLLHHGHLYGLRGAALGALIDRALERFGLAERRAERAEALSGGLRRRVELAKVLLHRPRILLLDEPATGLDPRARRDLWAVLTELHGEGVTVLVTTHFLEEAERCDRLALLDGGRIVAAGSPAELTREIGGDVVVLTAADPATLAADLAPLLAATAGTGTPEVRDRSGPDDSPHDDSGGEDPADRGSGRAASARGGPGRDGSMPGAFVHRHQTGVGQVRFTSDLPWELIARLARQLPGWEDRVRSVTVSRPSLEDVFLAHTGRGLSR